MASPAGIWVFGYGSLVWNPGFDFVRSQVGYIRGYDRRFWQGNDKHRGTPDKVSDFSFRRFLPSNTPDVWQLRRLETAAADDALLTTRSCNLGADDNYASAAAAFAYVTFLFLFVDTKKKKRQAYVDRVMLTRKRSQSSLLSRTHICYC